MTHELTGRSQINFELDLSRDNVTLAFPRFLQHKRFCPTFHTSRIKPFWNRTDVFPTWRDQYERPASVSVTSTHQDLFEIDRIVSKRTRRNRSEYLVGFRGYPDHANEWHPFNPRDTTDWHDDWNLLYTFDPSVGPSPPPPSPLRPTPSRTLRPRRFRP